MKFQKTLSTAALVLGLSAAGAQAESVIKVTLIDKMANGDLSKPLGLGLGMKADMTKAPMGVAVNPKQVTPGMVRLDVTNLASSLVHELQIARVTGDDEVLPYDQSRNKIDVEGLQVLGSVSEIMPSKSASLILELPRGEYLLFCNVAGHYMAGMWATINVK